jgi:two-component system, OmpR family, sensor kinase
LRAEARISLGVTLVTAVALASALILIHFGLNRFQERRFDQVLLEIARQEAADAARNQLSFSDHPGPAANDVGPIDKYGVIYGNRGDVLDVTEPLGAAPPVLRQLDPALDEPFDFEHGGRSLRGVRVAIPERQPASLLLAASREDLDSDDEFLDHAMLLAFIASMFSLLVCSLVLTKRFTAEHRRIATTLHSVAHGDLYARALQGSSDPDLEQWRLDLNGVAEQLSTLIRSQRRFIANAAHELKSPIAALYGELQQALRRERSSVEYQASISRALLASRRLTRLADELLTLARAEHDQKPLESVRLSELFEDVVRELEAKARDRGVRFESDLGELCVRGRAGDLQRLLRNLVDNALGHGPVGGTVRCQAVDNGASIIVRVSDDGPGVTPEDWSRVFEPFFRSSEARSSAREGSGLGLSIAREIARSHGGDVRIEQSERGAVFVIELPSSMADSQSFAGPAPAQPAGVESAARQS